VADTGPGPGSLAGRGRELGELRHWLADAKLHLANRTELAAWALRGADR